MPKFSGMNYNVLGTGKPIVLLHGWGADSKIFYQIARELSLNYKVYMIDFLGFGESEQVDIKADIYAYANDIEAFIVNVVQATPIVLGHSFGGRVGVILASRHLVQSLILVDSAGLRSRFSLVKYIKIKQYKHLKKMAKQNPKYLDKLKNYGSSDYKDLPNNLRQVFVRVVNEDLSKLCKKIACPVLLIWGKHDKDTPMYMAKKFRRLINKSTLKKLEGGHYSFLDSPQEFNRELYRFLENIENV